MKNCNSWENHSTTKMNMSCQFTQRELIKERKILGIFLIPCIYFLYDAKAHQSNVWEKSKHCERMFQKTWVFILHKKLLLLPRSLFHGWVYLQVGLYMVVKGVCKWNGLIPRLASTWAYIYARLYVHVCKTVIFSIS